VTREIAQKGLPEIVSKCGGRDERVDEADVSPIGTPRSNTSPEEYKAMVLKAKEHIAAGDIFQVVLSQRFETEFTLPPFAQAAPFAVVRSSVATACHASVQSATVSTAVALDGVSAMRRDTPRNGRVCPT
jgi:hypothetical protein